MIVVSLNAMSRLRVGLSAIMLVAAAVVLPAQSVPVAAGNPGIENAPPCRFSYDRAHWTDVAAERMIYAGSRFSANGGVPLTGPALADADAALYTAWSHSLEVINGYFALYGECVACNPYAVLGAAPAGWPIDIPYTLANVVGQLGVLEKLIHGDPARNELGSLAETLAGIRPWEPYCAASSANKDVFDLAVSTWEFGVYYDGVNPTTEAMIFTSEMTPLGRRLRISNGDPNQSFYWLADRELVLVDAGGDITTRLSKDTPQGDDDFWEGSFTVTTPTLTAASQSSDGTLATAPSHVMAYIARIPGPPPQPSGSGGVIGTAGGGGSAGGGGGGITVRTLDVWGTDYGDIELPHSVTGDVPTGDVRIPYGGDGEIIASFQGDRLVGHWIEANSMHPCATMVDGTPHWGRIEFTFYDGYTKFNGLYGGCDGPLDSRWDGWLR